MEKVKEIIVGVVKRGDKFLILRRKSNNKFDPDKWEFVSAFIKDKTNLEKYAKEQVYKETGLETEFLKSGEDFKVNDEYGLWLIHPFLFETFGDDVVLQPKDHSEYKWVLGEDLKIYRTIKDLDQNLKSLDLL